MTDLKANKCACEKVDKIKEICDYILQYRNVPALRVLRLLCKTKTVYLD